MSAEQSPTSPQLEEAYRSHTEADGNGWLRTKLARAAAAVLLAATPATAVSQEDVALAAESVPIAAVGMPFDGEWAYSGLTAASCGPNSDQNSHPSCHETYFGDWSTDLYAAAGTEVKLKVTSNKNLSFSWDTLASGSCGETRRVKVSAGGTYLGRIHFTHLVGAASTANEPTNGMTIGKIANLSCNPGGTGKHIHVEFDNADSSTYSCYKNYSTNDHTAGQSLKPGDRLGLLGSPNTGDKEECSSSPSLTDSRRQDLAWWTGSILNTRPHPGFAISSAVDGLAPPYWADVMDHNGDGLDDIVLFRENGGDIKIIRKNPSGGWTPVSEAVRGPNVAPPLWAATADLDGDGKKNDLIWWSANGISKLVGEDLNTKSTTTGIAAPQWADIIDYNQDGRDDIVLYRPDGSLRVLLNSASGGWTVASPNPVRTGVSTPAWAGVGDFDGDGDAHELAWWNTGGNISILNGENKFALMSTTDGIAPPDWADVTKYDSDDKDDVVFYRQSDSTINILRKSPTSGGFYLHTDNPIRGPEVAAPSWAKVGKFSN